MVANKSAFKQSCKPGMKDRLWHTALPGTLPPQSQSNGFTRKVYRDGKLVPVREPQTERGVRANLSRRFINQLNEALEDEARHLERLWKQRAFSKQLEAACLQIYQQVIETVDSTSRHRTRGAPPTLSKARSLLPAVEHFEKCLETLPERRHPSARELAICLRDLCDDVRHYVRQIEITFDAVKERAAQPLPTNRPTNWATKERYGQLVEQHQSLYGDGSFPKPRELRKQLLDEGHNISERTERAWRSQWVQGSFGHYIQNRNRQ